MKKSLFIGFVFFAVLFAFVACEEKKETSQANNS